LVVRFGSSFYALPSDGVRGVLTREEAGSSQAVIWVGTVYHDVNLSERLSATVDVSDAEVRTVLYATGHSRGAVRVNEVIGLIDAERDQCRPLPPHFHREERAWISGMLFFQERLALILNSEWVLGELGEEVAVGGGAMTFSALPQSAEAGRTC
jgi:hypothetical protein